MSEHDFEPIRGLPGVPPEGETILWQGAPDWRVLACEAFHIRAVAAYFAAMVVWRVAGSIASGVSVPGALQAALLTAPIALVALAMLAFLAWLNSRTTVYTITSRRVVMRFGAALPKAFNLPFSIIEGAALKPIAGEAGDLALKLVAPNKIAFLHLWPHVRPWRVASPQPTFRALPDAKAAAAILASAMEVGAVDLAPAERPIRSAKPAAVYGRPETAAA